MNKYTNVSCVRKLAYSLIALIFLVSCGGGGGSSAGVSPALLAALTEFNIALGDISSDGRGGDGGGGGGGVGGAAGDGAPIKRATVQAIDRNGVQFNGLTDDNGNFLVTTASTMTAPIVVKVIDPAGKVLTSLINENISAGVFKRVMVNPLTDKIVSDILDASVSGTDKTFDGSKLDISKLNQAIADLRTSVAAALSFAGVTTTATFNPITDKYVYDGNGVDAVIESISHKRNPATGVTQLTVKLSAANTNTATGVVTDTLITASAPLATTSVIVNASAELTYEKLNTLMTEINFCLQTPGNTAPAYVARCNDDAQPANGKYFFSANYKHSGMDEDRHFLRLFSDTEAGGGPQAVPGSTLRNAVILYTGNYPGSTATFNDLALVEFTIRQPRVGTRTEVVSTPIEYPVYVMFKRDASLTASKAGNWIAHGNQRNYDFAVEARYSKFSETNPIRNVNATGGNPSFMRSELRFFFNSNRFNIATQTWENAQNRAVRMKGPGLPAAGLVLTNSTVCGANDYLAVHNSSGVVGSTTMSTNLGQNSFRLNAVALDGAALYSGFFPSSAGTAGSSGGQAWAIPVVTDFSMFKAFNQYTAEIFLNSNVSGVPDAVEYSRILSPITSPAAALGFPLNDVSPSASLVTPGADGYAPAGSSFNVSWVNNLNSGPVESVSIYAEQRDPKGALASSSSINPKKWNGGSRVASAYSLSNRPTSKAVGIDIAADPDCGSGNIPSLGSGTPGDYREATIRSWQSRARMYNTVGWSNPFNTTTIAFPSALMPAVNTLQNYQATAADTVSNVPITITIKLTTSTATVTALDGSTSTSTRVFHSGPQSIIAMGATTFSPSVNPFVTQTFYGIWNAATNQYSFSANTTPAYVSAPGGTTLPITYSFLDMNGNWWSGIINGTNFVGTHYVPLTGSTRGIPGSSYRFRATVIFQ